MKNEKIKNEEKKNSTLRLLFPQWQGGNNESYVFGSEMLSWLAPDASGPIERVTVQQPDGNPLTVEDGIVARKVLLEQARDARRLIDKHQPERIVVLGGDCLVSLSPFAYLNEIYEGELAVLWLDTHPDIMTKDVFQHAHAMVMGNLLGEGETDFTQLVKKPIKPGNVMFAGIRDTLPSLPDVLRVEENLFKRLDLRRAGPNTLAKSSEPVIEWLRGIGAKQLAIHFDLDVLDPTLFRSLLFANPDPSVPKIEGSPSGAMNMAQVIRLLSDVSKEVDVVGLTIAEHLPWDSMALKNMLGRLPLIGKVQK
ncbi:arginase family protein [Pedobacter petrophilus]|uniref:Arginase family protein n=2 Tax=Pedobacter TaxID=84567 RepID=A0A7K0G557_9SPHI|nr:arginase family protein [Pedobacter petrophilus]MRX78504.1 arginase family protein [Pedobacter petrophilus]